MSFPEKTIYIDRSDDPEDSAAENPAHFHELFEIYFLLEGSCDYFIGSRVYHVEAGDLVLIPEGVIHNAVYTGRGHSRLLVNCASRYIPAAARPAGHLFRSSALAVQIRGILEAAKAEYERKYHQAGKRCSRST